MLAAESHARDEHGVPRPWELTFEYLFLDDKQTTTNSMNLDGWAQAQDGDEIL